jgi:RNA polymerase sigma-70 factor (TIGR02943 family)
MSQAMKNTPAKSGEVSRSDLEDPAFVQEIRVQMLRFATLQLGDASLAEDVVQEALIGALKNAGSFTGQAALKTWIFAILKNKIADSLRQCQRHEKNSVSLPEEAEEEVLDSLFDHKGHWQTGRQPAAWGDPEGATRDRQFWQAFEVCLDNLPGEQARVFMMREFIDMDSHEICSVAGITLSNLNVMLHRARLRLRACLETNWFLQGESTC